MYFFFRKREILRTNTDRNKQYKTYTTQKDTITKDTITKDTITKDTITKENMST